ncbi:MAG: IclR family transcriptional regulator [Woeseiaceae bacterium]
MQKPAIDNLSHTPPQRGAAAERKFVEALARGLDVLRAFGSSNGSLGNQEIAQRTGLPKATVSRLTYTLTYLGYLRFVPGSKKYELDTGVLALGYIYLSKSLIRQIAMPTMTDISQATRTSIGLATRSRLSMDMIYIASVRASESWPIRMEIGNHIPILSTATGRAWFAALKEDSQAEVLDYFEQNLPPERWNKERRALQKAVRDFDTLGYCTALGDWNKTVHACSVPMNLRDERIYVLNCGGPAEHVTKERIADDLGPRLVNGARDILSRLGEDDVLSPELP